MDLFRSKTFARITLFQSYRLYIRILDIETEKTVFFWDDILEEKENLEDFIIQVIKKCNKALIHDDSVIPSTDHRYVYGNWEKASYLEPVTHDFPQFGSGGAAQVITHSRIKIDFIIQLPTK